MQRPKATSELATRPVRKILRWQLYATSVLALGAAAWTGLHAAISALLGGAIVIAAGLLFALMVSGDRARSAQEALRVLLRAELGKIALAVLLLWLVFTIYNDIVAVVFIGAFAVAVLIHPLGLLVRE